MNSDHDSVREYLSDHDASCPSCGYALRGVPAARCPECAMPLDVEILTKGTAKVQDREQRDRMAGGEMGSEPGSTLTLRGGLLLIAAFGVLGVAALWIAVEVFE